MNVLDNREIEDLKQKDPRKKKIRLLFLITGLSIIAVGFTFFAVEFDFGLVISDINFSFLLDIILIIIGGVVTSKFFITPYYLRENALSWRNEAPLGEKPLITVKFHSFAWSRLIASILIIIAGLISLSIFGTDIGHEVKYGSAVFLGGPSWFYVTGLPAFGFGFGLLIYVIVSPFKGIFYRSRNFLIFYEKRLGFNWLTEIPVNDIEALTLQNNHLGPKLSWIVAFVPFIVLQLMTAIPLFSAERAGPEYVLSWTFIIISLLELFCLFLLTLFPQMYFEIATRDKLYEMWFLPVKIRGRKDLIPDFKELFNLGHTDLNKDDSILASRLYHRHIQPYRTILGMFLVGISIIMMLYTLYFGLLVWWTSLIYGFIIIIKSRMSDYSYSSRDKILYNELNKNFFFNRNLFHKYEMIFAFNVKELRIKKWFRKLDFFDIACIITLILFMTIQQGFGWVLADSETLIRENTLSTIIMIFIMSLLALYVVYPINVLEFKTPSIVYHIPITLEFESNKFTQYFKIPIKSFGKAFKNTGTRKVFLFRIGVIALVILMGFIYLIIFFSYFF